MDDKLKYLRYLKSLNPLAAAKLAEIEGIDKKAAAFSSDMKDEDWTPEACIDCLSELVDHNVWAGYLLGRQDIWYRYIKSQAAERYHRSLDLLAELGGPSELLDYLSAMYKFGLQVIPDQEYDSLELIYYGTFPGLEESRKNTTTDDTSTSQVVTEAVRLSGLRSSKDGPRVARGTGAYASLNAEKSTSIKPVRTYKEAYEFICNAKFTRAHWSLKMDGFNTKCGFKKGEGLEVALSRGRAADSWDYTGAVQRIIEVNGLRVEDLDGKITGEALVDSQGLQLLREKYPDKDYKSPKSTAGAMLRAPQNFAKDDYQWLRLFPFAIDDMRKDLAFIELRKAGFITPPELITTRSEIPLEDFDKFKEWLDSTVLDPIWKAGGERQDMSDGVVLQLLDAEESDRADKYSDSNIALKFSHWTEREYESKVVDILFEQQRVYMSVVLVIEPVVTRDLNMATRVSIGSPAILVHDGVKVGDIIKFARKSEAINIYLGKK